MLGKPIDNERRACDAVVRCIEDRSAVMRSNAYSPEDGNIGPPVEYVFDLGAKAFALEHTVVEAFSGQIQTDVDFVAFVRPITQTLDHHLPAPGTYHLSFISMHPSRGLKPKDISKAQAALIAWVRNMAEALHAECPEQPSRNHEPSGHRDLRRERIEGVEVQLHREVGWWMPNKAKGRLFVARIAPANYEALRTERLKYAINKKLPKLQLWKKGGARSVLVFENRDLALSNHVAILEAAENALVGRLDRPDEVWLVDTTIETEWTVWCLIRDGIALPDDNASIRFREFKPSDLTEV